MPATKKATEKKTANTKSTPQKATNSVNTEPALKKLFIDSIKDIYWAENHLTKVLPKMQKAATSEELATAIGEHLEVTKTHVSRLEEVFGLLDEKIQAKKCDAMEGLAKEGESILENTDDGTATRDVGIIMASQKVEHYEIASYGSLVQIATTLGLTDVADLLAQTLAEEKDADATLTEIAENNINSQAAEG